MIKKIAAFLFTALTVATYAQDNNPNSYDTVRTTNVWYATNIVPHTEINAISKPKPPQTRKILIIVENRAGANLNDKISVLEDLVSSRVAGKGFSVVSRDVAVNALKTYPTLGVTATTKSATTGKLTSAPDHITAKAELEQTDSAHLAATPDTTGLDQALSDNPSALRLAQNLNVDYILIPSITSDGT